MFINFFFSLFFLFFYSSGTETMLLGIGYEKKHVTMKFLIEKVCLNRRSNDYFEVQWARHENRGTTLQERPNEKSELIFQHMFECRCTMYIKKSDRSVRKKIVDFLLIRKDGKKDKKYGRLRLDISDFYAGKKDLRFSEEMESGKETAPVFYGHMKFEECTDSKNNRSMSDINASFIGTNAYSGKTDISEWDGPSEVSSFAGLQDEHKKKEKKHRDKHRDKERKREKKERREGRERKHRDKNRSEFEADGSAASMFARDATTEDTGYLHQSVSEISQETEDQSFEYNIGISDQFRKIEAKPEEVGHDSSDDHRRASDYPPSYETTTHFNHKHRDESPSEDGSTMEDHRIDLNKYAKPKEVDVIDLALSVCWPDYHGKVYFEDGNNFSSVPCSLKPIMAALIMSGTLDSRDKIYEFLKKLREAPLEERCTNQTKLEVYYFILSCASGLGGTEIRYFKQEMYKVLVNLLERCLAHPIEQLEVVLNRLATAKFESETIYKHFMKAHINAVEQLPYSVRRNSVKLLNMMIDYRLANKILKFQNRFNFENSSAWLSFLTILESDGGVQLRVSKQVVLSINMGARIAVDFELRKDICPDLTNETIVFILSNISTDKDYITEKVDPSKFAAATNVPLGSNYDPPCLNYSDDLFVLPSSYNLRAWENCRYSENVVSLYPFIEDYR